MSLFRMSVVHRQHSNETHDLITDILVSFTHITSDTLSDTWKNWSLAVKSYVTVVGLTLKENSPVSVGYMCKILNNRTEVLVSQRFTFFTTQIRRYPDRIRHNISSYDRIFLSFVRLPGSVF
jgi:exoribonuclease R